MRRSPVTSGNGSSSKSLPEIMALHERILIIQSLQEHDFNRTKTAAALGISRRLLYDRISILKIDLSSIPGRTGRPPKGEIR